LQTKVQNLLGLVSSETLRPADDAYEGDYEFKQRVGDELVKQALVTKEDIEKEIERTKEAIAKEIECAKAAIAGWSNERQNGTRKLGSTIQRFVTRFANFLTAYSDIVELVKNASSPYGNVAYGTLSLLFIVNDRPLHFCLSKLTGIGRCPKDPK
jgi:hypothetical protein